VSQIFDPGDHAAPRIARQILEAKTPVEFTCLIIERVSQHLSGTAHWMFDRGLLSLSDDLDILISRQANDPDSIRGLINKTGRAIVPTRAFERPHSHFLRWHRDNCLKH
jgi:hypothetical protein